MHSIERKSNSSCYINAILFLPGIFHFQEKFVTWNTFNFNTDIKIWTLSLQDKIFLMHFIGKESMHHPVSQYNQSFDKFLIEKKLYIHLLICQHWNGHNNSFQRRLSMNMSYKNGQFIFEYLKIYYIIFHFWEKFQYIKLVNFLPENRLETEW